MNAKATPHVPLNSDNAALVLVDHQVGLLSGVRDIPVAELKNNVVSLAKAMRILKVPIIAVTTARDSMWGPTFPELVSALPDTKIIDRSTVNAWDDACGTFSQAKHEAGLLRMQQAGVILSDYATLAIEILKDNGRPDAGAVYAALAMPFAVLVGQIAHAYGAMPQRAH
jgi:Isochorismatase family